MRDTLKCEPELTPSLGSSFPSYYGITFHLSSQCRVGLRLGSVSVLVDVFPNILEKRSLLAQNNGMDQRLVIEKLRHHEPELKAAGILHIRVFGSVARNEATTVSDVDLLADFDKSKRMTLVKVGSLQSRLSAMLGARVDLSSTEWMREPVKSTALREAVIAF